VLGFSIFRIVQVGFKSLRLHKLRSGLTMLGIVIGVWAVITLVAIGEGASHDAQEAIKALGANNVIIRSVITAQTPMTIPSMVRPLRNLCSLKLLKPT
jgi:putative ABC transport system permease protein